MAPAPAHPMSTYEARKASFLQKEAAPGPSRKKGAAATTKPSWPHPFSKKSNDRGKGSSSDDGSASKGDTEGWPSPRSLANLGLYYDPTAEANDQCSIYPDGHTISGWKQGQSALERLEEENPTISWAMIEKSKRASEAMTVNEQGKLLWTRQNESIYPSGKVMIDARWRTYGGAWPLDGKKGWKPTSKKLASAGFHFSPNDDEEDCVSCAYCQCSLGGWEKTDDPVKEHQKRKPGCAIFVSELEKPEKKQESSRAASSSTAKSRIASKKRAAEPEDEEASSSTRARSRSSRAKEVQEEVIDKSSVVVEETKPAAKKRKKAAAAKVASEEAAVVDEKEEKEERDDEPKKAAGTEKEIAPPPKAKAKKATKKAPAKKKAEAKKPVEVKTSEMEVDDKEIEASDFEEEPSRSHSRDSGKDVNRAESPPTSPVSETFKTPKQTASGRPTDKTPKASSPVIEKVPKSTKGTAAAAVPAEAATTAVKASVPALQQGDIAPFDKLDTLTLRERSMTVEEWLRTHVKKACTELGAEGIKRIALLRTEMDRGRAEAERILRGINVN